MSKAPGPRFEKVGKSLASQSDVKSAARESVNIKWQRRWEVSEKGRQLFTHRPGVKLNKVEFGSLKNQRAILQLQSGYCRLKEYQNKVGIADSPTCECGAIEDVQHFLLECPNYHVPRETLRQSLLLSCGIADFDTEIVLQINPDRTRCSGSTERMRVICEARSIPFF